METFPNYAGKADKDEDIATELELAGIEVKKFPESFRADHPEMRTIICGQLPYWGFKRVWCYWVASGPGIPPRYANELHEKYGKEVRVDGHCACPSPLEWFKGFAVGNYHVDTQRGLKALADTIRKVMEDAKKENDHA